MSVEGTEILGKMNFHENVVTNNVLKMTSTKIIGLSKYKKTLCIFFKIFEKFTTIRLFWVLGFFHSKKFTTIGFIWVLGFFQ